MKRKYKRLIFATVFIVLLLSFSVYYFFFYMRDVEKTLLIGGSSTVYHYTQALAEAYMDENSNIKIIYESGGSTPGLIAVKNGSIDIASMSRDLEDDEDDQFTKNYLIGKDAIGIVIHPSNPVSGLTTEQVREIFTGKIDSWMSISGRDMPIHVVIRFPDSATFKGLDEMVLQGADAPGSATVTETAEEMARAVASDPSAVGFLALRDLQDNVKAVEIGGVPMNRETILTDRYRLSRSFYYVVYDMPTEDAGTPEEESLVEKIAGMFQMDDETVVKMRMDTIRDFLDFVKSPEGQQLIEREGAIRVY